MSECKFFLKGTCFEGVKCKFRHIRPLYTIHDKGFRGLSPKQCSTFKKTGKCPHGNDCLFSHKKKTDELFSAHRRGRSHSEPILTFMKPKRYQINSVFEETNHELQTQKLNY